MRDDIRAEIETITPYDRKEAETKQDVLNWIDSGAELCRLVKPDIPPKHLVSYFVLLDGEHVLLVDHIKAGLWLPAGGHVDPGEHPQTTVVREAKEELGIQADLLVPQPVFLTSTTTVGLTAGHVDVSLWYKVKGDRDKPLWFDQSEFQQIRWFHRENAPLERADPEFGRFLKKVMAK